LRPSVEHDEDIGMAQRHKGIDFGDTASMPFRHQPMQGIELSC
jgi:hypothetical protein